MAHGAQPSGSAHGRENAESGVQFDVLGQLVGVSTHTTGQPQTGLAHSAYKYRVSEWHACGLYGCNRMRVISNKYYQPPCPGVRACPTAVWLARP